METTMKSKGKTGSRNKAQKKQKKKENAAVKQLLEQGVACHNQGQLQQALDIYRNILTADPTHPDANHLLGILTNQTGNPKAAIVLIRKAIESKPNVVKYYNNLGLAYKADKRRMEASVSFQKAINMDPDYLEAHLNIAQMKTEDQAFDEAVKNYETALNLTPDKPRILVKLASTYLEKGDLDQALDMLEQAGVFLIPHYKSVLQHDSDEFESSNMALKSLYRMGLIFNLFSERYYAALCMARVTEMDPDCSMAYSYFANIVNSTPMHMQNESHIGLIEKITLQCLNRSDLSHGHLRAQVIRIIDIDGATRDVIKFFETNTNDALPFLLNNARLLKILSTPCFLTLLKSSSINNLTVEKLLTKTRESLLFALLSQDESARDQLMDQFEPLILSLSHQSFLNEYVYYINPEEQSALTIFEQKTLERLQKNSPGATTYAAMLGCYKSLGEYSGIANQITMDHYIGNTEVAALVALQITNPKREKAFAESIQQFKTIENSTSQLVREQYEENPYPRWATTFRLPPHPVDFLVKKTIYPNAPDNLQTVESPKVLVAGSGTGQHPISCALYYANASILAVDLSLASLSYAKRQAEDLNINNIEFMQADILDLGDLEQQFDVVESSGVLHHMKDPLAGWKVLEGLLKPNGLMKIGLYSELARKNVVAARNFIQERGFEPTLEGIRECRKITQAMDDSSIIKSVTKWSDFFSTSMVRDLIFHSMEHRFTLPQIEEILTLLNLEFLGFCAFDSNHKTRYLNQFPDDKNATSLANWHIYETQNPDTFQGMYQFWLRKKTG